MTPARISLLLSGGVYALFAAACFRLAIVDTNDIRVSIGEGAFTLLGALALLTAVAAPRRRALIVIAGTVPLVVWFAATPWNSGPPFLIASLVVPLIALGAGLAGRSRA